MPACSRCGQDNPEVARFCLACGAELAEEPAPSREVRKTVTVVFTDVTGSTSLGEKLDPESLRRVMTRYFDEMRAVLERHGGTVEKFIGDAVMAVFGVPQLHEDDALRAVRAAADMRAALAALNEELLRDRGVEIAARTGVNTGPVVAGDPTAGQALVTGDAVNVSARLEQAAQPGEILIGEPTYRLTRDAVTVEPVEALALKGKAEAVPAYRLVAVTPGVEGVARRLDSPLVGRVGELVLLRQALDRVIRDRGCHLFTLLGPAGIGKTRLVEEFVGELGEEAAVLRGRCLPYGEGITFWPVAEAVRGSAGVADDDSPAETRRKISQLLSGEPEASRIEERIAQILGLSEASGSPEETPWAVRKLLEALARERPAVVVFDDAHWAEPAFLDLIEHVADWTRDAPILLFCLARPELLDQRPGWGGGKMNATSILLEPLSPVESEQLVDNLLGGASLDEASRRRIAETSEGNPLFVEQLVAMLIDEGLLRRDDGHWLPASDLSKVSVPPTIQALLASRLDRLGSEERQVVERASVIGRVFYPGAVSELSPDAQRSHIPAHLMTLVRKELIRPDRSTFAGEETFRFRHLFVRDAAYDSMPKQTRAELHERFAGWLERTAGERVGEYEEILGYHLEQASRYRAELGPLDERGLRLAEEAGHRLLTSGRRALARGDQRGAVNLYGRALDILPREFPGRAAALIEMARALFEMGEYERVFRALDDAAEDAAAAGDRATEAGARLDHSYFRLSTRNEGWDEFRGEAERAIATFRELGDDRRLARALYQEGVALFWVGRSEEGQAALDQSIETALSAGDVGQAEEAMAWHDVTLIWGHMPVEEGARRNAELLSRAQGKYAEAFLLCSEAFAAAANGDFDAGRAAMIRADAVMQDMGLAIHLAAAHPWAEVERHAENWEAMVPRLTAGVETLERMGDAGFLSTTATYLAEALYRLGRDDEAERFAEKARAAGSADDASVQVMWRSVQAKVLARRGRAEEAERLIREAVELAERTDYHGMRGDAKLDLAEVLRMAGRSEEARIAAREAEERYEIKGDRVLAERARAFAATLGQ